MNAAAHEGAAEAPAIVDAPASSIRFSLLPLGQLQKLEPIWRQMDSCGGHSFFLSWTWIGTWLAHLPAGSSPLLLEAWHGRTRIALAILCQRRLSWPSRIALVLNASGDPLADGVMIEHNGLAASLPLQSQLMDGLAAFVLQSHDELVLPGTTSATQHHGWLRRHHCEAGFRTPLAGLTPNALSEMLSRNARQQLHRSMRACRRLGELLVTRAEDEPTAMAFFSGMKALHMASWRQRGRRHAFDNRHFEPLHRALALQGLKDDNVDLLKISAGQTVLGYLYNFRRGGVVSNYQSGFDPALMRLRPGYVCHALAMMHYAERGEAMYDFLAGTNRLKQSLGQESYTLHWQVLRRPTALATIQHRVREVLRHLRGSGTSSWA